MKFYKMSSPSRGKRIANPRQQVIMDENIACQAEEWYARLEAELQEMR